MSKRGRGGTGIRVRLRTVSLWVVGSTPTVRIRNFHRASTVKICDNGVWKTHPPNSERILHCLLNAEHPRRMSEGMPSGNSSTPTVRTNKKNALEGVFFAILLQLFSFSLFPRQWVFLWLEYRTVGKLPHGLDRPLEVKSVFWRNLPKSTPG